MDISKNIKTAEDIEALVKRWKDEGKPSKIAASFTKISELEDHHIKHFRTAAYIWKPMQGSIFGGMLLDDDLDYIHLVLANQEVLNFILNLRPTNIVNTPTPEVVEDEEPEEDLDRCEQCEELAWDGYICHACGMKHI